MTNNNLSTHLLTTKKVIFAYIPIISIIYIILSVSSYMQKSPTFDEGIIIASGHHYLVSGKNNINTENPPLLKALFALPTLFMNIERPTAPNIKYSYNMNSELIYAGKFLYQKNNTTKILNYCRFVNVLLTLLAGIFIYLTITIYLKRSFGLLGFLLFVFSPNILAHARLATVDTGLMMFMFGANYFLIKGFRSNRMHHFTCAGLMAGVAMLCKFTGLLIVPIFAVQFLIFCIFAKQRPKLLNTFFRFILICFIAILMVNIFYGFSGFGKSLAKYKLKSPFLKSLNIGSRDVHIKQFKDSVPHDALPCAATNYARSIKSINLDAHGNAHHSRTQSYFFLSLIENIPVPLPHDYIKGFDIVAYNNKFGFPNIYMGKYYPLGGTWWDYYLILMGIKLPVPLLILIVVGLIYSIFILYRKWIFYVCLAPPLIIFVNFSFLAYRQSGFRYILAILPYLFFCAVIGFRFLFKSPKLLIKIMAILIAAWFIFESMFIYPDYLTYFNQFAGGSEGGKNYFAATNLDWGQDLPGLKKWLNEHNNPPIKLIYYGHAKPGYYGIEQSKTPKYIAISVTNMYIYNKNPYISKLLKTKPIANIGNSIYIYKRVK